MVPPIANEEMARLLRHVQPTFMNTDLTVPSAVTRDASKESAAAVLEGEDAGGGIRRLL